MAASWAPTVSTSRSRATSARWNADTNTLTYGGKDYAVGATINAPGGGGALRRTMRRAREAANSPATRPCG